MTDTVQRVSPGTTGTQDGKGYVVYDAEVRVGGTLAWRNNNPGNIRPSSFTQSHGAIGSGWGFAVFPDEQTGTDAVTALLKTQTYQSKTIKGAIFTYAPPSDNNDSQAYVNFIHTQTGLDPNRAMSSLSDDELAAVVGAIRKQEGWTPGTTYTCANGPDWVKTALGCGATDAGAPGQPSDGGTSSTSAQSTDGGTTSSDAGATSSDGGTTSADGGTSTATPVVTSISPSSGSGDGGTTVTIGGSNLSGVTAVNFGSLAASSFSVDSDSQITAVTPAAEMSGTVDVTVTSDAGTSDTGTADQFQYE